MAPVARGTLQRRLQALAKKKKRISASSNQVVVQQQEQGAYAEA